jgi:hypothetical protein
MLQVFLDCPFLIAVIFIGFSVVFCLFSTSVLFPNVASVSGLSILDCPHLYRFQTKHNRETYTDDGNQEWTIQKHWQHWEIRHWT